MARPSAIIVGAGIGGTAAGFRLQAAGWRVKLLEREPRAGGRMKTVHRGGFMIDVGAGILPGSYAAVLKLIRDAGLDGLVEQLGDRVAIPRDGKLHYFDMARPKRSLMTSALLPMSSKRKLWRVAFDLWRSGKTLRYDSIGDAATSFDRQSAADYCRRYLDQELLDYLVDPTLRTLYLNSAEEASIVEFLWSMKNLSASTSFSLKGGMDRLAAELADRLPVEFGATVEHVERAGAGTRVTYRNQRGERTVEQADVCILAADGKVINRLFRHGLTQRQSAYLANMRYSVSVNVHIGLSRDPGVDALIVQVPAPVDPTLAALVMDHRKGSGRAPPGKGLVSAFFCAGGQHMLQASDAAVLADAVPRIAAIIPGFEDMIQVSHIERWRHAATITEVGQCARIAQFEADLDPASSILLASDLFAPSSVNTCVVQGERAARRAMALLGR